MMKAHIYNVFVWVACGEGYKYYVHAIAAHSSKEAENLLISKGVVSCNGSIFINTDEHVNNQTNSEILPYYTACVHEPGVVPKHEYETLFKQSKILYWNYWCYECW